MRTTNNIQKTENKPIKKTISKAPAIVISFILISFTVSAQVFWKQILVNNTDGKMAELMVEQKNADDQLLKGTAPALETTAIVPVDTNQKQVKSQTGPTEKTVEKTGESEGEIIKTKA
jgi:hypothetical protein